MTKKKKRRRMKEMLILNSCYNSIGTTGRYSGIYTISALALMGHDHVTLKHDYDNLLIDRRMLDHSITGSVVCRQKSHMEAPFTQEL